MTGRRRRAPKQSSTAGDIFHFICAIALIALAVLVVFFVAGKLKGMKDALEQPAETTAEEPSNIALTNAADTEPGLKTDEAGQRRWLKEDGSYARSEWIEGEDTLYYFNEEGLLQTGLKGMEGMLYTFSEDGRLEKIRYNPSYSPDKSTVLGDYPSLVKSKRLWAFLEEDEKLGGFSALMYKRTTEAMAHQLGGDGNPQYTGPYSMQIDGDYIYFLPLSEKGKDALSKEEASINEKLYRMRPGDETRQIVAENVEGYKVLDGKIYYYADGRLFVTEEASDDKSRNPKRRAPGEDIYRVEIMDGAAYLTDSDGKMLSGAEDTVAARGFTYYLNEDGTIRDVKAKTSVNTGGYTYFAETDTAFGETVSRIVREDASGGKEVISAEFPGTVGNIRYDYDTRNMIAEYTDENGRGRIIQISRSGDVDLIADDTAESGSLKLIAVQDGTAVGMREGSAGYSFKTLTIANAVPLAVGIDPIAEAPGAQGDETEISAPPQEEAGGEAADTKPQSEKPEETKAAEMPASSESAPKDAETPHAKPSEQAPSAELIGPEGGAVIGNAPPA